MKNISSKLNSAENHFAKKDYNKALTLFGDILIEMPDFNPAKIGVLLCDLALDHEHESHALYDYYTILRKTKNIKADEILLEAIKSFDGNIDKISDFFRSINSSKIDAIDGIMYEDFKQMIERRGSFKRAFEDLMYSTKIVISGHDDFIEFMNKLVDNGFKDVAINYLENAGGILPFDEDIRHLINKINMIETLEEKS